MTAAIITICILILVAYIFDLSSARTRIPSVILLLLLGWIVQQATTFFSIPVPDLEPLLPALGTIGLILIVLEGALELELNRSKLPVIRKAFLIAAFPIVTLGWLIAFTLNRYAGIPYSIGLLNAIPLCVISSAIAIPTVKKQPALVKEFIVYESSLSDIIGILFFNFLAFNTVINANAFGQFTLQLLLMIVISFGATIGLSFLLSRIRHHIKFAPIVLLIILIYEVSKVYQLPALLFILLFGLFLGNLDELKRFRFIEKLQPDILDREVHKFNELVVEGTFLVRSVFFILFGFLMRSEEIVNTETLLWAVGIVAAIIVIRLVMLKIAKLPLSPLLFIAPRGLITILLFVSILPEKSIPLINKSLIIQVIVLTAFMMMFGMMFSKTAASAGETNTTETNTA